MCPRRSLWTFWSARRKWPLLPRRLCCTLCSRVLLIVSNWTTTVQWSLLYLNRRPQLTTFAKLALGASLVWVFLGTCLLFFFRIESTVANVGYKAEQNTCWGAPGFLKSRRDFPVSSISSDPSTLDSTGTFFWSLSMLSRVSGITKFIFLLRPSWAKSW